MSKKEDEQEPLAPEDLAKRFKYFRKHVLKLTQEELAEKLGAAQSAIFYYEKAERSIPTNIIRKLHDKDGMNLDWFYDGKLKPTAKSGDGNLVTDIQEIKTDYKILEGKFKQMEKQLIMLTRELMAMKHNV